MKKRSPLSSDVRKKTMTEDRSLLFSHLYHALLVILPPLVVLAAFRNSLTWHLQQFWGASGDFWQGLWDRFIDTAGDDPFTLYVWWSFIVSTAFYWIVGLIFTFMDVTLKPATLRKYKVQPGTNEPVDPRRLRKVIEIVLFNQFLLNLPAAVVLFYFGQQKGIPDIRELPTFNRVLFDLVVCILLYEFGFYYSHRLMHHKYLYKRIHKMHHEWTSPIGLAAMYAHPIEHVVCNLGPLIAGPFLMKCHVVTTELWFCLGIFITIVTHSGYHLPFMASNEFHDFHHLKFTECFGAIGFLDRFHNTDKLFRSSGVVKRHKTLLGLTPIRELYPLSDKNKSK